MTARPAQTIKRLVVKCGSSVLTDEQGRLQKDQLRRLAEEVAAIATSGRQIILVSSGAIACGMSLLGLKRRPREVSQLQACAAIGQSELMHFYSESFAVHKKLTAQVLLTQEDLAVQARHQNATRTLQTLLDRGVIPIINENDTVSVEEITFGDNDRLAALVASAVDAQLLVLLSDVEGLLAEDHLIERIDSVSHTSHKPLSGGRKRQTTKGGMTSKLMAAKMAGHHGIPTVIASGSKTSVLSDILDGKPVGTLCVPAESRLSRRKWRIAFALRHPRGKVIVDDGAAAALVDRGRSLLPTGVVGVFGRFDAEACVSIVDSKNQELARGVTSYSSAELARIQGLKSAEAAKALGRTGAGEVIHRDHMVLSREMHP